MATIMSFDTMCHLEAIERDLIDVLIDTEMIHTLRQDVEDLKFRNLLDEIHTDVEEESTETVEVPVEAEEVQTAKESDDTLDQITANFNADVFKGVKFSK